METCRSDIYVYFNVNFNVFFKLIKVHLLVSELNSLQYFAYVCSDEASLPDTAQFILTPRL